VLERQVLGITLKQQSLRSLILADKYSLIMVIRYQDILTPAFIGMLYLLLFPLIVFFAGMMIVITVRAKTFKEAQSLLSPLNIVVLLPAMAGLFPGFELNGFTAMIPIVNIVLATKDLMAGTLEWQLVALAFGIMILLAVSAVFLSYKKFESESTLIA
jgi:sodium transport system permease protein